MVVSEIEVGKLATQMCSAEMPIKTGRSKHGHWQEFFHFTLLTAFRKSAHLMQHWRKQCREHGCAGRFADERIAFLILSGSIHFGDFSTNPYPWLQGHH